MLEQVLQRLSSLPVKWDKNLHLTISHISNFLNFLKSKVITALGNRCWKSRVEQTRSVTGLLPRPNYVLYKEFISRARKFTRFSAKEFQHHRNQGSNNVLKGHSATCNLNAMGLAQSSTKAAVIFQVIASDTRGRFSIHRILLRARILEDICTFIWTTLLGQGEWCNGPVSQP